MSHKTKDCMERPRGKGAKWTGKNIAADEKVEAIALEGFDAKHDRWNGYSADDWVKEADKFEKVAAVRQGIRQAELLAELAEEGAAADAASVDADAALAREEDKVEEAEEAGFSKVEMRVRAAGQSTGTVRNLRIREDTAKYLLNLDVDSAYYDPKSRSMRLDPNPDKDPAAKTFAGDNFVRTSGASEAFRSLNAFSVTAYERGQDVHLQATPSQAEVAFQTFKARKDVLTNRSKEDVLARYGDAAERPGEELRGLGATEAYVEYDAAGRVLRGQETKLRSRYAEDVHPGNHAAVWGSWWGGGRWGYACCRQTARAAYCTGAAGGVAAEEAAAQLQHNMLARAADKRAGDGAAAAAAVPPRLEGVRPTAPGVWGTEAEKEVLQLDEAKLKEALARQEAAAAAPAERDDRKRGYNAVSEDYGVTPEEMEAYRMVKARGEDPMAAIEAAKAAQRDKDGGKDGEGGGGGGYDYV
jgi:pre-mRNA-processing factor SLU7